MNKKEIILEMVVKMGFTINNLSEKLDDWQEGLDIVSFTINRFGTILVIGKYPPMEKDDAGNYVLTRYFPTGKSWQVSVDWQDVTLEEITEKLCDKMMGEDW